MLLSTFFEHIKRTKTLAQGRVFCFSGLIYPLLFFYHLIAFFKRNKLIVETLDCIGMDIGSIKALLSTMSFSGEVVYWLEGFYALPEKKQQEMFQYFSTYEGPHRIVLFSDKVATINALATKEMVGNMHVVPLPNDITAQDFSAVRFLVSDTLQDKSPFASQIAMYSDYLSLDNICLFAHYELVVGKNSDDFFSQWMARIVDPTSSFFVLSQHFLSKKSKPFFRQWATVSEHYLPTFWASFWADQVWRAYVYCDLMKQKKYADAKKAQYKLPFSFINRDWSLCSLTELRNAHQFLCSMDFRLKNGGSELGLEHFYSKFFENKFQQK